MGRPGDAIGAGGLLQLQLQIALVGQGLQDPNTVQRLAFLVADGFAAVQYPRDAFVLQLEAMFEAEGLAAQPRLAHAGRDQIAVIGMDPLQQQLKADWQMRVGFQDSVGLR